MTNEEKPARGGSAFGGKPKTRWGCIIGVLVVVLILAGLGYLFFYKIYPFLSSTNQAQNTYSVPQIKKEAKDWVKDTKSFGEPIRDDEPVGRVDPFAPIP